MNAFIGVYVFNLQIDIYWLPASRKSAGHRATPPAFTEKAVTLGCRKPNTKQFFPVKVGKNFPLFRVRLASGAGTCRLPKGNRNGSLHADNRSFFKRSLAGRMKQSTGADKMKKRNVYSGDFKAKVVLEAIQGSKSLEELANTYCLHPNLIKNWKSMFMKRAKYVLADRRRKTTRNNGFWGNL